MNHLRAQARVVRRIGAHFAPVASAPSIDEYIAVEHACADLSPFERKILHGVYVLGLKQKDMAVRLSLSARQVGRLHRHALTTLQRLLAE
jgi:DNA-directed RNA polymerase specialized sigma24 family protein